MEWEGNCVVVVAVYLKNVDEMDVEKSGLAVAAKSFSGEEDLEDLCLYSDCAPDWMKRTIHSSLEVDEEALVVVATNAADVD